MQSTASAPIPFRRQRLGSGPVPVARRRCGSEAIATEVVLQALIVDDCRFIAERVARALEAKGYHCSIARDGYRGLEQLRGHRFDLLVLDVDMPMVNGFSVLRQLRASGVHTTTPVLMLSAEPSASEQDRAVALGANAFMSKPLQLRQLYRAVDSIIK